uniref:MAK10-like protein n=1 Tax=Tanacetum cinerariifolium TaxID=118510 RepID=A0A6L2KB52_TANCI|nr:MAK10-like protein [Tanacetum cinerariifolium]
MGYTNPIRTLGDYSKPSHEGYMNTIELPVGNNVVPLRSDTIRLVQNGCSFDGLRSKDPNQQLKDFLKLMNSLDLNDEYRERTQVPVIEAKTKNEAKNRTKNKPIKKAEKKEAVEAPSSQPVEYYLKHRINEKLIKGLVDNNKFNDSLLGVQDIKGKFEIPCNIGGLKLINALVDQGFDMNIMPLFTYMKLTNERPAETDVRLSLASHSYIYPLRIAKVILVDVAGYVYPVDFMILDIKEDKKRSFILGTPFLTTAKAVIKFDKGTITLRCGKSTISFHRIPKSLCKIEKGIKNDIEPIAPIMIVNMLVLEWEEKIKLHQEKEMEFDR